MNTTSVSAPFNAEQKEYLAGLFAGLSQPSVTPPAPPAYPYVGVVPSPAGELFTADAAAGGANLAAPAAETIHGTPLAECTKQELWKRELHGLDAWDRLLEHAEQNKFPNEADQFRFRFHGLFYVAPAQDSFMLRCRIPAGELTSAQLRGLAGISVEWGHGKAAKSGK